MADRAMLYTIHRYPTHLIDVMTLPNGQRPTVRPVLPQDDRPRRVR